MSIVAISKHQYYYKPTGKKQGISKTKHTKTITGELVSNIEIVNKIKEILENPNTQYGYIKITYQLKTEGYIINKKKVYILMKEHNLLGKRYSFKEKTYAQYRKVLPQAPLESFHSILSRHLKRFNFWSMDELEQNLILFYESYNNTRIHGSIAHTSPRTF